MSRFYAPVSYGDGWRHTLFVVIFGHSTRAGRLFDLALIVAIVASVAVILADSMPELQLIYGRRLLTVEWAFTVLFTIEYLIRLCIVRRPTDYALSFYGVIDLLALLPTYLSLLIPGAQYLAVIRVLRVLRIFEVLHLRRYSSASSVLLDTLHNSWRKILVFLMAMLAIITIFGALIFVVEGPEQGFTSIPLSMYWALVSVSTVGYGDLTPGTPAGRMVASLLILIGYGIIAVPTGIYTAELATSLRSRSDQRSCSACGLFSHASEAIYCRRCAAELPQAALNGDAASDDVPDQGPEGESNRRS